MILSFVECIEPRVHACHAAGIALIAFESAHIHAQNSAFGLCLK